MTGVPDAASRYRGAMLGLAAGDALGTTLEFRPPGTFEPVSDIVGGGPFGLAPGEWTDDTSMALCLAESLIESRGFDPADQMSRYLLWRDTGYMSSNGRCFDIGNTVGAALCRYAQSGDPFAGDADPCHGGNGSLMRLAPVPLAFSRDPVTAIELSGEMSRTTHAAPEPVDACRYYAALIVGALAGVSKSILLGPRFHPARGAFARGELVAAIDRVAAGSFHERRPPRIRGSGYVVDAIEAALWAFAGTDDFRTGALAAVNLGDDADTTGAIYGELAGAYYGEAGIPLSWRQRLRHADRIRSMADALLDLSAFIAPDRGS
ncbi:MAG: ADP-ribosylglycohydrolase family protein [Proteobacteria bacterium]|nr:MAG: ADP-ribosylglycohydrolase family protein [Pseudomonadota bacterium]